MCILVSKWFGLERQKYARSAPIVFLMSGKKFSMTPKTGRRRNISPA
jgi:hypothetical protein